MRRAGSRFFHTSYFVLHTSKLVSRVGIEPTTNWLKANCSTTELPALFLLSSGPSRTAANHTDCGEPCQPRVRANKGLREKLQGTAASPIASFSAFTPLTPPLRGDPLPAGERETFASESDPAANVVAIRAVFVAEFFFQIRFFLPNRAVMHRQ